MNHQELAQKILDQVGGINNITQLANCATRLRMNFKDESLVHLENIKKINGVIGATKKSGQYQIIIGTDVGNVCAAIKKLGQVDLTTTPEKKNKKIDQLMDIFASIFTPVIPAITAAGMIKAMLVVCVLLGMSKESQVYSIISFIADAGFYFLPIMLAFSSANKLGCNPYMAAMIGGVLLHPNFVAMVSAGEPIYLLGLPVKLVSYGSSVIPIILAVWLMTYVERFADKISPRPVKFFMKPVLTILIVAPIVLIILGPLGSYIGMGIATVTDFLNVHVSWLVPTLMGAFMPLLVLTGMHWSFLPILMTSYSTYGYEAIMGPGSLVSNICQGGASLSVALKTKNKELKQLASSAGITALMGITEPAMYGITLKLKKPLIAVMIGGGIGGFYAGLMGVVRYTSGTPGLLSLPIFIGENPMNIVHACIACIIGFIVTFVLTWMFGFEDPADSEIDKQENKNVVKKNPLSKKIAIYSPTSGKTVQLSKVNDETFAKEITGKGIAIDPFDNKIVAPFDGEVLTVFRTKHAIGLVSTEGVELLIHIGIDTVELEGKYFTAYVHDGDRIKKGDVLIEFDQNAIKAAGYECIIPIIVTNTEDYLDVIGIKEENVESGEQIITVF
ncbi:PTS system beta-glucoside-specific IIA component (Glc family) /PTS system beta-glucoside-specific IIB component (Glc family) /PTS system beta-glucoside-specific IIC component (Glc family) [Lachnotalea glycerini]|uniref:PTS system beta-glucoside-specific IIA component (Glc family) /PTS system beta-glucoside-specific IIB component (Glc family) /PTS system beta-glucoside-specific IIC component (Glc family) n=1 Tax=Lachnotalea glycerini TaxID=1763509 RepID=A0A318EKJ9_9FIRM|nr:beta-glucoside-specific PTS transporter subunit IIABC [Lachnotalea glycerini]PXV89160.1 PTS system beta-glucoside-specific IIA component (Glc family) /PTS system beta-glucoside-specific IIB component (Glc family) /PTS system beta-glucoside-specific IIC component (Glc family) [Lachnotalea glycerini]